MTGFFESHRLKTLDDPALESDVDFLCFCLLLLLPLTTLASFFTITVIAELRLQCDSYGTSMLDLLPLGSLHLNHTATTVKNTSRPITAWSAMATK